MEGWNPFKKKSVKEVAVAAAGIAVAGAAGAEAINLSHQSPAPAEASMPAERVDPTAGMTPESAPKAIVVEQTGVVHPEAMMEEDDRGPESVNN